MSSALVKVGLPSHLAEGARFAKRVKQLSEERDAAFARIESNFRDRLKTLIAETETEVSSAVANSEEEQTTSSLPS